MTTKLIYMGNSASQKTKNRENSRSGKKRQREVNLMGNENKYTRLIILDPGGYVEKYDDCLMFL